MSAGRKELFLASPEIDDMIPTESWSESRSRHPGASLGSREVLSALRLWCFCNIHRWNQMFLNFNDAPFITQTPISRIVTSQRSRYSCFSLMSLVIGSHGHVNVEWWVMILKQPLPRCWELSSEILVHVGMITSHSCCMTRISPSTTAQRWHCGPKEMDVVSINTRLSRLW